MARSGSRLEEGDYIHQGGGRELGTLVGLLYVVMGLGAEAVAYDIARNGVFGDDLGVSLLPYHPFYDGSQESLFGAYGVAGVLAVVGALMAVLGAALVKSANHRYTPGG